MNVAKWILIVLQIISSLGLIVTIMLQSGKEEGLSGAISGNGNSYLANSKKNTMDAILARATKYIAIAFVLLTLGLSVLMNFIK